MIIARITRFDEELVEKARHYLAGVDAQPQSRALLEQYGMIPAEVERGRTLVENAIRSFEWERTGQAWNFLSPTPERRRAEAVAWYKDARRRHIRECLRRAEELAGWNGDGPATRWSLRRKLTEGTRLAMGEMRRAASIATYRRHRGELARDLERAAGTKPTDAPPPKDTTLVELSGWYERWRLLAQRIFRGRPDLMLPFGLTPGKAPPRLRGKQAKLKYGEQAAGGRVAIVAADDDDGDDEDARKVLPVVR